MQGREETRRTRRVREREQPTRVVFACYRQKAGRIYLNLCFTLQNRSTRTHVSFGRGHVDVGRPQSPKPGVEDFAISGINSGGAELLSTVSTRTEGTRNVLMDLPRALFQV